MCQLIFARGGMPPADHLENSWSNNPDGGGIMIQAPDKPAVIFRSMDKTEFLAYCAGVKVPDGGNAIIHFRFRSHGTVTIDNVHPFLIPNRDAYLFHNGVVNIDAPSGKSDTYAVAQMLGTNGITAGPLGVLGKLESTSKFIVAAAHGIKAWGVNTKLGTWNTEGNIWYANNSHTYTKPTYTSTTYTPYKYEAGGYGSRYDDDGGDYGEPYIPENHYRKNLAKVKNEAKLTKYPTWGTHLVKSSPAEPKFCCWCGKDIIGKGISDLGEYFCKECWKEYQDETAMFGDDPSKDADDAEAAAAAAAEDAEDIAAKLKEEEEEEKQEIAAYYDALDRAESVAS